MFRRKHPDPLRLIRDVTSEETVLAAISLVTAADMVSRDGRAAIPIAHMLDDMTEEEVCRAAMVLACWICGVLQSGDWRIEEWAHEIRERMLGA